MTTTDKIFATETEQQKFVLAVKRTLLQTTENLNEEIPRKSRGKWKTIDDVYPDKKKFISLQTFQSYTKKKRKEEVFYCEDEKDEVLVVYKCKITGEIKTEKSNMYIWVEQTAEKSKYLAPWFYPELSYQCQQLGLDFIVEEVNGYDAIINGVKVELKIGQSSSKSQLSTGNNHSKVKVDDIISIQFIMDGNDFVSMWVAHIDMSKAVSEDTKWSDSVSKNGKNNNGFSSLTVGNDDYGIITCYYGKVRKAKSLVNIVHESINA